MRSYHVKEDHIGSAVTEILRYKQKGQTYRHPVTLSSQESNLKIKQPKTTTRLMESLHKVENPISSVVIEILSLRQ